MASWNNKRVLITGAGGFIGSHLTERLVEEGAIVRALVHYNALGRWGWLDHSSAAKQIEIFSGDVTDRDCMRQAVRDREIIFHLGALIAIPYSYQVPLSYVRTNLEGTLNVLQAARDEGVERVVHTSTSEVYGTAQYVPIDELHPLKGQSPYAASKIGADKMVEAFHLSFNLPVVTVRPFNTFGPRQSIRAIIPTIIIQCLLGDRIHLGNLHPTRDLNFVTNTVDGFLLAASEPSGVGQTINLGSNREISIGDLASLIAKMIDKPIQIESEDKRLRPQGSEVERLLASSQLAQTILGWQPKVSLEEGLMRTIAWIKNNLDFYRGNTYAY
jgi:NAD dependent epimerase/dehydratase